MFSKKRFFYEGKQNKKIAEYFKQTVIMVGLKNYAKVNSFPHKCSYTKHSLFLNIVKGHLTNVWTLSPSLTISSNIIYSVYASSSVLSIAI